MDGRGRPATARQKVLITRLAMALGIRELIEERPMSIGDAGREIDAMRRQLQARRGQRHG